MIKKTVEETKKVNININIRLPSDNKRYYEFQLKQFAERFDSKQIIQVSYGKQDVRGTESITLVDKKHCVPVQIFFYNKWELLGFVTGFNAGKEHKCSRLYNFLSKEKKIK